MTRNNNCPYGARKKEHMSREVWDHMSSEVWDHMSSEVWDHMSSEVWDHMNNLFSHHNHIRSARCIVKTNYSFCN